MINANEARQNNKNYEQGVLAANTNTAKEWCERTSEKIANCSAGGGTYICVSCEDLRDEPRRIAETLLQEAGFGVSYNPKRRDLRISW